LAGFNWSNSVNAHTIENAAELRNALNLEKQIRFEHHVTETWKGLVIQPYDRRQEVIELAQTVPNISAKHEGGEVEVERSRLRPSEIQDYYRTKAEIIASGEWEALRLNFLDKFESVNITARALTERGLSFVAAKNLHL
jgi:bifunctional DNA-binding transcriptional regulator/antitoxin component of YhaV-PrlF toxin-antitoxin module